MDIVLNPLGVPSRMNVGQVLETHLGWAAEVWARRLRKCFVRKEGRQIRKFLEKVYNTSGRSEDPQVFTDEEDLEIAGNLRAGVPMATPVFDGAAEEKSKRC